MIKTFSSQSKKRNSLFKKINADVTMTIEKNPKSSSIDSSSALSSPEKLGKQARKQTEKRGNKQKSGSLGWGFLQGFNLFITLIVLAGVGTLFYMMMDHESRHQGPAKYVLDPAKEDGQVIFNPAIPEEIRQSYVYIPPIKDNINDETIEKIEAIAKQADFAINLISSEKDPSLLEEQAEEDEFALPKITLSSLSSRGESTEELDEEQVEEERQQHIAMLLSAAHNAMANNNYVGVNQNDAYYFYNQILFLEADSAEAHEGLNDIATIYLQNAKQALLFHDYANADRFIKVGLVVVPDHPELKALEKELR